MSERVVITGIGVVSPIGNNKDEVWENCKKGFCGIAPIKENDLPEAPILLAGEVKNLDMEEILGKRDVKFSSRFTCFARIAAKEAYADSKLGDFDFDRDSFGVMISSSIGGGDALENAMKANQIGPFFITASGLHSATASVAIDLDAHGCNMATVSACAGGANAIGEAFHKIKNGLEDIIICGGAESALNLTTLKGFCAMRALYNEGDVNKASIPFDEDRKGFVPAEGAAVLILENMEHAKKRGAHIYAEVAGYGCTCDAFHSTAPREDGIYAGRAMSKAMKEAGVSPKDIDYINAHGTGTKLNDFSECVAIKNAFGDDYLKPFVSSTKSMTGHLLSAGGALEAILSVLSLEDGFIPATINIEKQDEKCDINLVKNEGIKKDIRFAMSNSFGFGGHNAVLIFKKAELS